VKLFCLTEAQRRGDVEVLRLDVLTLHLRSGIAVVDEPKLLNLLER
jgi:hypothetical protein